ncbi:heat shock protein HtpX [Rhizobium subbaraonis]|uniref:Heat shock protein HtpX n=1 Tax=Rhizobium subbaraonis TaxID=908946 RepID=A0A285V253_9HYPH|nr:M48 family metalloprotease [Rhizobium subbaraonis]SOC48162.1 heat shock protein HtpX [Rhizobium subbaraonis]
MTEANIDHRAIQHSTFPTWLGLVGGSWVGLIWGSLITAPVGIGLGVAAGTLLGGLWAVPLWGTVWGFIGLGRQRANAVREHGIALLKEDDPLALRVHALAARLGLRTRPWVGTMPHNNAYAIGANADNALVVIGQPLIDNLSEAEVDAIIGHELGHVVSNDMRRMGLARSFQNALVWYLGFSRTLQRWGRWILTWLSELYVLRLSRKREYWADAVGAALTSKEDMITALEKLHQLPDLSRFERQHARLMVRGQVGGTLLSTHPTLQERRSALQSETYMRRLPTIPMPELPAHSRQSEPPRGEDVAYARR